MWLVGWWNNALQWSIQHVTHQRMALSNRRKVQPTQMPNAKKYDALKSCGILALLSDVLHIK